MRSLSPTASRGGNVQSTGVSGSLVPGSFRQSPQKQSTEVNEIIFEVLSLLLLLLLFSHCSYPTLCDPMDYSKPGIPVVRYPP